MIFNGDALISNKKLLHFFLSLSRQDQQQQQHHHHINNNMVPIISVTPHSPGTKFNNILGEIMKDFVLQLLFFLMHFQDEILINTDNHILIFPEDTLNHLQNIRESVVQMKNSTSSSHHNHHHHHHHQYYMASGLINPAVSFDKSIDYFQKETKKKNLYMNNLHDYLAILLFNNHKKNNTTNQNKNTPNTQ